VAVRRTPRFLARKLTASERRVYAAATAWFVLAAAAMMWPLVALFARVRPLVLGLPFALFGLALILTVSFAVGVALYRWESRRGVLGDGPGDEVDDAAQRAADGGQRSAALDQERGDAGGEG